MASMTRDSGPGALRDRIRANPRLSQLVIQKYRNEMPTAITTARIAKPILAKRSSVSKRGNVHSYLSCSHRPSEAVASSSGAVVEKARSAVIGSTQTTVSNMARLLPAIMV